MHAIGLWPLAAITTSRGTPSDVQYVIALLRKSCGRKSSSGNCPALLPHSRGEAAKSSLDWQSGFVFLYVGLSARDMAVRNI